MSITHEGAAKIRRYLWSHEKVPTVKIAVLGYDGVGKRGILERLCHGHATRETERLPDPKLEYCMTTTIQGKDIDIQFELAQSETSEHMRPNEACFLVYDVTRRETFDALEKLRDAYRSQTQSTTFFVIANRIDRWRGDWTVSMNDADDFARGFGATLLQMSELTGRGTGDEVVVDMLGHILLNRLLDEAGPKSITAPVLIEEDGRVPICSDIGIEGDRMSIIRRLVQRLKGQDQVKASVPRGRNSSLGFFAPNHRRGRKMQKV